MNKEMMEKTLKAIESVNESTRMALEVLRINADTIAMLTDEISHGAVVDHPIDSLKWDEIEKMTDSIMPSSRKEQELEEMADKLVKQIQSGDSSSVVAINIDVEKFDPFELMSLVQEKLDATYKKESKSREDDEDDNIDFCNPLA
jgi:hypothetical protein